MVNLLAGYGLAALSGLLLYASYPLVNWGFLAYIALVPLFLSLQKRSLSQSFLIGWLVGFTMFFSAFYWLKIFHFSAPFIFAAFLGLQIGGFAVLYRFLKEGTHFPDILLLPVLWSAFEFSRFFGSWAVPVGLLGYSQHQYLPIIQIVDIIGVPGLSFLIVLVNAALYSALTDRNRKNLALNSVLVLAIFGGLFLYGNYKLASPSLTGERNFKVALIQPNTDYFALQYNAAASLDRIDQLTIRANLQKPDLIVWPENVVKGITLADKSVMKKLARIVVKYRNFLIYGRPHTINDQGNKTYVTAFLITPAGKEAGEYFKMHLVPFIDTGIYLPFIQLTRGKISYEPSDEFSLFKIPKARIGINICFDGLFPDLVSRIAKRGAQFMVSIVDESRSNSAYEHYNHAAMTVFRSVENRIYYVRAANSGVTMAIDPAGRVIRSLPIFTPGYLVVDIGTRRETTFYTEYGDVVGYLSFIFVFGLTLISLGSGFEDLGKKQPKK